MKRFLSDLFSVAFLFLSLSALFSLIWTHHIWGDVYIEQILINMEEGVSQVSSEILKGYKIAGALAFILSFLGGFLFNKNRHLIGVGLLSSVAVFYQTGVISYLLNQHIYSDLYEKEYVDPKNTDFVFPKEKRNLIMIYLESMEENYANSDLVGQNLIPNLKNHQQKELHFEGFHQLRNQDYTMAAIVEGMCGIPYKRNIFQGSVGYQIFLDNAVCIPEIFRDNGYQTFFIKGASIKFARTDLFLKKHGFQDIQGALEIEKNYKLPLDENTGAFSGYQDRVLFEIAKQKLTEISKQNKPFLFEMITLDTHQPDVYLDKKCNKVFNDDRDIVACADKMIGDFIGWLKEQDFYSDTTIVVLGDHPETGRNALYPYEKNRRIVNFILNPAGGFEKQAHTSFTTLDFAPTILNAAGVQFKDGKFGLGRSLFQKNATLFEKMGLALETELSKASHVYEKFEEGKSINLPAYNKYELGAKVSDLKEIEHYTVYCNIIADAVYLSDISFRLETPPTHDLLLKVRFKTMLNNKQRRDIKVFQNGVLLETWTFGAQDKQPIEKTIRLSKDLAKDGRFFIEILADDPFIETFSIGLMDFEVVELAE